MNGGKINAQSSNLTLSASGGGYAETEADFLFQAELRTPADAAGLAGQVLTSGGASAPPTWSTPFSTSSTTSLSTVQIAAANTTPIQLVAAPGAGKVIIPVKVVMSTTYGTAVMTGNTTPEIRVGADPIYSATGLLGFGANRVVDMSIGATGQTRVENTALNFSVNTGDPTPGASTTTAKVTTYYQILTL